MAHSRDDKPVKRTLPPEEMEQSEERMRLLKLRVEKFSKASTGWFFDRTPTCLKQESFDFAKYYIYPNRERTYKR